MKHVFFAFLALSLLSSVQASSKNSARVEAERRERMIAHMLASSIKAVSQELRAIDERISVKLIEGNTIEFSFSNQTARLAFAADLSMRLNGHPLNLAQYPNPEDRLRYIQRVLKHQEKSPSRDKSSGFWHFVLPTAHAQLTAKERDDNELASLTLARAIDSFSERVKRNTWVSFDTSTTSRLGRSLNDVVNSGREGVTPRMIEEFKKMYAGVTTTEIGLLGIELDCNATSSKTIYSQKAKTGNDSTLCLDGIQITNQPPLFKPVRALIYRSDGSFVERLTVPQSNSCGGFVLQRYVHFESVVELKLDPKTNRWGWVTTSEKEPVAERLVAGTPMKHSSVMNCCDDNSRNCVDRINRALEKESAPYRQLNRDNYEGLKSTQ